MGQNRHKIHTVTLELILVKLLEQKLQRIPVFFMVDQPVVLLHLVYLLSQILMDSLLVVHLSNLNLLTSSTAMDLRTLSSLSTLELMDLVELVALQCVPPKTIP